MACVTGQADRRAVASAPHRAGDGDEKRSVFAGSARALGARSSTRGRAAEAESTDVEPNEGGGCACRSRLGPVGRPGGEREERREVQPVWPRFVPPLDGVRAAGGAAGPSTYTRRTRAAASGARRGQSSSEHHVLGRRPRQAPRSLRRCGDGGQAPKTAISVPVKSSRRAAARRGASGRKVPSHSVSFSVTSGPPPLKSNSDQIWSSFIGSGVMGRASRLRLPESASRVSETGTCR